MIQQKLFSEYSVALVCKRRKNRIDMACSQVSGLKEMLERFNRRMCVESKSIRTRINYSRNIASISMHYQKIPSLLSADEISDYLFYIKNNRPGISATFFKHTIYGLKALFRIEQVPEINVCLPKIKAERIIPVILTKEEVKRMINQAGIFRNQVIISLLYSSGMRCGELVNLSICDIDLERNMLIIRRSKNRKDRCISLGDVMKEMIIRYCDMYKPLDKMFNWIKKRNGEDTSVLKDGRRSLQKLVKEIAASAGISKNISVHTLRHTFATHLIEAGYNIFTVQELMGHSSVLFTMQYIHIAQMEIVKTFNLMDKLDNLNINCTGTPFFMNIE
ncbi:MAG: tyrosine-type recombinase/integrase [Ferruginibacter sp.]